MTSLLPSLLRLPQHKVQLLRGLSYPLQVVTNEGNDHLHGSKVCSRCAAECNTKGKIKYGCLGGRVVERILKPRGKS